MEDEAELGSRLEEVWLKETKLKVQKAKFGRQDKYVQPVVAKRDAAPARGVEVMAGRTFTTVVQQGQTGPMPVVKRRLVVTPSESRLKVLANCFVAILSFHREAKHVQNSLMLGGLKNISVTSMGDNMVMLESNEPLLIIEAERRKDQWWRGLFKSVKRWLPNMVVRQRRIWLRFHGLPMHVWDEQSFKKLGTMFGEFLDFDEDTINSSIFDMARLLVGTTSMALVNEQISVEVMGAVFNVWVMEEMATTLGLKKEAVARWEDESISSYGGQRGGGMGDKPEFEEVDSIASSTHALSVRSGDNEVSEDVCNSLLMRQRVEGVKHTPEVGQASAVHVANHSQGVPIQQRHVAFKDNPHSSECHADQQPSKKGTDVERLVDEDGTDQVKLCEDNNLRVLGHFHDVGPRQLDEVYWA